MIKTILYMPRANSSKRKIIPTSLNAKMLNSDGNGKAKESIKRIPSNKQKIVSSSKKVNGVSREFKTIIPKTNKIQLQLNQHTSPNKNSPQNERKKYNMQKTKIQQKKSIEKGIRHEQYFGRSNIMQRPTTAQSKKKLKIMNSHKEKLGGAKSHDDYQIMDQINAKLNKLNPNNNPQHKKDKKKITLQPSPNKGFKIQVDTRPQKAAKIYSLQKEQNKNEIASQPIKGKHTNTNQNTEWKNVIYQKPSIILQQHERESKEIQKSKNISNKFKKEMQIRWQRAQKQSHTTQKRQLQIQLASECFQRGETDLSRQYFQTILQDIDSTYHQTPDDEDTLAYVCAFLTNIHIFNKDHQYQQTAARALQIYDKRPKIYYQQKITLKNNIALASENNQDPKTAIALYREVLELEDQFYSISDERRLSTLNNLFCLYCVYKMTPQAKKIYNEVNPIIRKLDVNLPIYVLWIQNCKHYSPILKKSN